MANQLSCLIIFLAFPFYQSFVETKSLDLARIQNGVEASAKQFPYQVYIRIPKEFQTYTFCGGTIISERIILTAAHCVDGQIEGIMVYFGTVDIGNIEEKGQQRLLVKPGNVVKHRKYDAAHLINDIAIIKLPTDLEFDEYIQPAKLPSPTELYDNQGVIVSGWGAIEVSSNNTIVPDHLMYHRGNTLSSEECKPLVFKYSTRIFYPASFLCLGPSESSPCFGDSGGPLVRLNDDGSSTLLGICSFVMDTFCTTKRPSIYTRISSFLKWIKRNG